MIPPIHCFRRFVLVACLPLAADLWAQERPHVHTNRQGAHLVELPEGDDAFAFAVYGDRTGGRPEGLAVLEQAVADTNLLDPDLVMTVGDLVQGYNATDAWQRQAAEFSGIMDRLEMAWFPVAGNHDVYFRGDGRPKFHHEESYEAHFGPLWYAFEHKQCLFVVLYSDEGDRETGAKGFGQPALQRMSPEQFAWLDQTLTAHADERHVFVFLHHPRWLGGGYGDDWERVHARLAAAGNVRAVFAGHIHRMRYDGVRDGIEYFALATTGGNLSREVPRAGYLHHFDVVTVRGDKVSVATIPVGAVLDPRQITGALSDDVARLDRRVDPIAQPIAINEIARADQLVRLHVKNPCSRPIEVVLVPEGEAGFVFEPDHVHLALEPGEQGVATVRATRAVGGWGDLAVPVVRMSCDYLAEGLRISLPDRRVALELMPPSDLDARSASLSAPLGAAVLDGGSCVEIASRTASLADGPITVEAWIRGADYRGRIGLATKTENSEYGLFVSDGRLTFSVHLDGGYASARSADGALRPGVWHHVAGVFDGATVRVCVDGVTVGELAAEGVRTRNELPLFVGADVDGVGAPTSHFRGEIAGFRLSNAARYGAEDFVPEREWRGDADTVVLLPLDRARGPWTPDVSGRGHHGTLRGAVRFDVDGRPPG